MGPRRRIYNEYTGVDVCPQVDATHRWWRRGILEPSMPFVVRFSSKINDISLFAGIVHRVLG